VNGIEILTTELFQRKVLKCLLLVRANFLII